VPGLGATETESTPSSTGVQMQAAENIEMTSVMTLPEESTGPRLQVRHKAELSALVPTWYSDF